MVILTVVSPPVVIVTAYTGEPDRFVSSKAKNLPPLIADWAVAMMRDEAGNIEPSRVPSGGSNSLNFRLEPKIKKTLNH